VSVPGETPAALPAAPPRGAHLRRRLRRLATWEHAHLFAELTRAAMRAGDHNSLLGAAWSLLSPFVMLVALYLVFRNRFGDEVQAYPLYLLIGISLVNYFVTTTRFLISILFNHRPLLLNTTVPRETVVASQLAVHSSKLLIEMGLCGLFSLYYGLFSPWAALAAVPLLFAFVALTTGVGLILALIHCFARDVEHIWSLISRLLLFVTPVFYTLDGLPPLAHFFVAWLNPLTPFLVALRSLLIEGSPAEPLAYAYATVLALIVLAIGYTAFLRLEGAALERA
jgi:ABC-2 type transport system permease protein